MILLDVLAIKFINLSVISDTWDLGVGVMNSFSWAIHFEVVSDLQCFTQSYFFLFFFSFTFLFIIRVIGFIIPNLCQKSPDFP